MAKNIMKIEKLSGDLYETDAVPSGSLHNIRGMSNEYSQTIREGYAVGTFWEAHVHDREVSATVRARWHSMHCLCVYTAACHAA
jgi:hypothetical protein